MSEEHMAKKAFVDGSLARMLGEMSGGDIVSVEYQEEGYEEFVHVVYGNGYQKRACVTGDSLRGILEDVIDAI